jgi:hypothetical protein
MSMVKLTEYEFEVTREIWINPALIRYFYQSVSDSADPSKIEMVTRISFGVCGSSCDTVSVMESPVEILSRIKAKEVALV